MQCMQIRQSELESETDSKTTKLLKDGCASGGASILTACSAHWHSSAVAPFPVKAPGPRAHPKEMLPFFPGVLPGRAGA